MLAATAAVLAVLAAPAAAVAANAVTQATPNTINRTFGVEHTSLALEGTTDPGVIAVQVTLDDTDPGTAAITLPATVATGADGGSWTLVIAGFMVTGLADGPLSVSTAYTLADAQVVAGDPLTILKDTVAPLPPTATPAGGLFNLDLSVSLSADLEEDVRYTTDGTEPTALSPSYGGPIAVTRTTAVRALAVDRAGNVGPSATFNFSVDKEAPVTTAAVPAGFHGAPVPVTLTATDAGGSGVATTWYTTDGTDPTNPAGSRVAYDPARKPVLGDGERLHFASVDAAGNIEVARQSAAAQVDTTPPVTSDDVPASWQPGPVEVTLTANDGTGSGVAATYFTLDGSDPADSANANRAVYNASAKPKLNDGQMIRYASVDAVGNVEAARTSAAAKVDTTRPVTTDDVPAEFQSGPVTVTLTATDSGSGVADVWYTLDGSDPADPASTRQRYSEGAKPTLGDGETIRYASVDAVGNVEVAKTSAAAKVDTTRPVTTDDVPAEFRGAAVEVTLSASDPGGSGVARTYFTLDGSDPADSANAMRAVYSESAKPKLNDGQTIRYASVDGSTAAQAIVIAPSGVPSSRRSAR
ncbi:MAG TPA: chitobiase/beta-hexosaminidase C-terminal domain-containing protein, partial [Solirubrobacteraceae bacterium]|nr:chitobiase/beta-hexosaminidase C-terminal domain-containing protein [Solirubrobacteraceae bacterium]